MSQQQTRNCITYQSHFITLGLGFPLLSKLVGLAVKALTVFDLYRFPSSPLIVRVPFFLLFGFNKGAQKEKG